MPNEPVLLGTTGPGTSRYGNQQRHSTAPGTGYGQVVKAATAATAGGSMLVFSGLTLAGTVLVLAVATPPFVIFSPIIVPAGVAVFLLAVGFLTSGGLGVAAMSVLSWLFKYVTGVESVDRGMGELGDKGRDVKDWAEQKGRDVKDWVEQKGRDVKDRVEQTARDVKDRADQPGRDQTGRDVRDLRDQAHDQTGWETRLRTQPNYNRQLALSGSQASTVVKAVTAATVGGSLLALSGLTLAGTVGALTITTPLMVILTPVLVLAAATMFFLATGFMTSGGLGVAGATVLSWLFKYMTSGSPQDAGSRDQAKDQDEDQVDRARDMRNRMDQTGWETRVRPDQDTRDRAEQSGWEARDRPVQHYRYQPQQHSSRPWASQVVKAVTAATAGGSLLVFSGLTLTGTVIALVVATPLMVIFSPVLVPAIIAVFLLASGFFTSGGFGIAGVSVLTWLYRYVTGGNPPGADSFNEATNKLGSKAREVRDQAEHAGREIKDRVEHGLEIRDRPEQTGPDRGKQTGQDLRDRAKQSAQETKDWADRTRQEMKDRTNPTRPRETDQPESYPYQKQHYSSGPQAGTVVKAVTAATAGGSLLLLSGLTLAGTVLALTVTTPLMVFFSPVLVPAVLTVFLLATGFLTSGGLGVAATTVFSWLYRNLTSRSPQGSHVGDLRDRARQAAASGRDQVDQPWDTKDHQTKDFRFEPFQNQQHYSTGPQPNVVIKAVTAATAGGSLLVLSGLTLTGTNILLNIATPPLVLFSPVLVPAVIAIFLLTTGFLTSGGLGIAATTVLSWLYRYVTGGNPPGAESLDQASHKLGSKAQELKNKADLGGWDQAETAAEIARREARERAGEQDAGRGRRLIV